MSADQDKTLSPFDFINSVNSGTKTPSLLSESKAYYPAAVPEGSHDKSYTPFMVNRGLSYFADTVLLANEMNCFASLPAKMQYDFLRHTIRPAKRFSKWAKKLEESDDMKLIMIEFSCSAQKARELVKLYPSDELEKLRQKHDKGGSDKVKKGKSKK